MKSFVCFWWRIIHLSLARPAPIILLLPYALFLNQAVFAGSTSVMPPESPKLKSSNKKTPMQCSSLCQSDLMAGAQAAELEKFARKAQIDADKAAKKAASVEKKVNKKLHNKSYSSNTNSSGSENPKANALWKVVKIVPRLFVSTEARARADAEEKEAAKSGANPLPANAGQEPLQLLLQLQMELKTAEDAQKVAADAKREADQARAHADSVRQAYKSCLSAK